MIGSKSTYGMPVSDIVTSNLPVSGGTALEIDCSEFRVTRVNLFVTSAFRICFARSAAEAATKLASDNTSGIFPGNFSLSIDVSGAEEEKPNVYLLSTGAAVTDGVTHWLEGCD